MKRMSTLLVVALAAGAPVFAGLPAARVGDLTSSGGSILPPGAPTVVIGGAPAARVNDLATDPLVQPPGLPCVGGPIVTGSTTVLIGGQRAARMTDQISTQCGVDTIVTGSPNVSIGN